MDKTATTNLYPLIIIVFLSFILLAGAIITINQQILKIFTSWNVEYFKVFADQKEEKEKDNDENPLEQKICNKLFELETCEQMEKEKPIEKKKLTKEEIKEEAIINRYLEPVDESKKKSMIDNRLSNETEIGNSNIDSSNSVILSNEMAQKNVTNINQQSNSDGLLSTQINRPSIKNPPILQNSQNINNLNQVQLVDLIASTISNENNIDKNKIIQSINDLIEPTKAKGGNVIDLLKKIADNILKEPSGSIANKILNIDKTK
ncbi:MAG TPA: hypothetical protein VLA74_01380 [Nitrososphaeraceae archaeon]|nr:hypothetical protein [Nitrososphaeraceae archaeon]